MKSSDKSFQDSEENKRILDQLVKDRKENIDKLKEKFAKYRKIIG